MTKTKRKWRTVYISKAYFPSELHPAERFTEIFEKWRYLTETRTQAARAAWAEHAERLRPLLRRQDCIVSLHVSGDSRNNTAGRLIPIQVADYRHDK
jgi:hypothetical protein